MWTRIEVYQILGKDSRSSHYWKRKISKDICGPGRDWRIQATTSPDKCVAWSMDQNWKSRKQEWAIDKPNSTMLKDWEAFILFIRKMENIKKPSVEVPMDAATPCKKGTTRLVSGNWTARLWIQQDSQNKACMYSGGAWVHKNASGIISTERWWRSHCRQRVYFDDTLQFWFTSLFLSCKRWRFRMQKAAVDKQWQKLETTPAWQLEKVKSKKEVILEAQKRAKNSPLCYIDGHLSSQKCGVRISLTLRTRNSRKPLRILARNWKHHWLPLCLARQARTVSMGRLVVNPMSSNQNLRVFWKLMNLQDCVWEIHCRLIMKTILQEKETIH